MNGIQSKAEFYAKLANIEQLKDMQPADQGQLMIDAVRAGLMESAFTLMTVARKDRHFVESWLGGGKIPGPWIMIYDVHPWARDLIRSAVDKGEVDAREFEEALTKNHWRPEKWILNEKTHRLEPQRIINAGIVYGLRDALLANPLPFTRCAKCQSIFVPGKNQKYCGKSCATETLKPWRSKYMKTYMRDRRKHGN